MKHLRPIEEKKPKGAPDWHDSDAPDANGRFRDLSIKDLAAWLIKTRKKDVKRISGSLTQQIVFNRNDDPKYAEKMEKTRKEVYKQLGREDLLESVDMDDLKNAKEKLSNPHTILDITYSITRRGDRFVRFDYENKYVPGKMVDSSGPHFVKVFYGNDKDLKKISKELKMDLKESTIDERKEYVGRYNTVKKVIAKIGRRPSEQEVATFITNNYYDVTEVERGWDDPQANDKIADLVAFYKFDIDDWNIAWADAQNESLVNEAFSKKDWDVKWKMPKDNLFNATKTTNAVNNRYNALQSLLKSKPKELKAFDADENHPAYDMTYDELMKWYNKLDESLVTEASTDRMIKQIKRALKDGLSIFKLPMATQKYYAKNKSDFETVEEAYKMEDIYDLIAHHRFDKDFKKLSSKDKEWVENDAKERGFNESLLESDMFNMYYSLIDELYEAKPGPDAYMTGLSDEEKEEKEAKMKKQAEMDDDDPDSYEELPGDEEAREKGKVKKSKHTTAYNKKFKSESMKNLKSFDNFVTEKRSDLWSPFQKADILAGDMFGAMGLYRLEDDELDQIIDLKKADKLAKKMFGEFGFKTLAAKEMEDLLDNNPKLLRESAVNEFGPMRGSGNRDYSTSDLADRIGELDDILMSDRKAEREWEEMSQNYLDGEKGSEYWADLGDQELQDAIDDAESLMKKYRIKESVVNEAEKYITDEFKVGDKIKTNFGEWEVIETDYAPGKSFTAPFIFKGKDMKRVDIPNPPKTNKNAVGYKVTDGDKYPIIGFLYQYKDITKLATVGVDESVITEEKIKYAKGKTYQSSGHYTVQVDSNSSMCDIRVNSSAGWRLDPHDDREETWELLDGGRKRATLYFRRGNIDKFAQQMFDLNDRTTWGNKTKLTAKDYADIIRLWIDMKKANESRNTGIFSDMAQDFEDFVKEKKSLNEASLAKIHRAAKKGSYPVSLVVIENGKVVKQELVGTPQIVPAAFNQLKKEYPNATVHVESKTGERLFSESTVNEAKFFRLPTKLNAMWELKNAVDYIVGKHDNGDDYKPEEMKTIEEFIKKIKKSAKAFKSAEEVEGTVYESAVIEAKRGQIMPGDYVKTQYGDIYLRVDGKVGKSDAYVRVTKGKAGKKKTGLHDSMKLTLVENRMLRKGQFRFGSKLQYGIEDVNESYGFYGTLMDQFGLDEVNELFLDGFSLLGTQYDFTDQAALYYLNSKAGRWVADQVTEKLVGAKNMSPYYGHLEEIFAEYAKKGQWKKWSKEYDQFAEEDNIEEGLMIRESKSDMDEYYRGLLEAEQTTNDQSPLGDDGMETGIKNKSKESGVPVGLLRIIMRRGLAAWKTGHRPGATQAQWGYARVNSFLTKQPGTWGKADSDIAKKVRDGGHDKDL